MTYSEYKLNKQGDNIQLWRTPFPIRNQCIVPCLDLIVASWPAYRFLRRQIRWSGILISLRILKRNYETPNVYGYQIAQPLKRTYSSVNSLDEDKEMIENEKKFSACEANNHEKQWIQKLEQMQGCVLNREYFLPPGQRYNTFIQQDFKITNVGFSCFCFLNGSVLFSWVVASFSKLASMLSCFSRVQLFVTLWIVVHQAPLSMGFSRQEYWSGLLYTPPEDLSKPGIEPIPLMPTAKPFSKYTRCGNI